MNTLARLVIRIGRDSLSFAVVENSSEQQLAFEPYVVRGGISMAANLREAFATSRLLGSGYSKVHVVIDSPVVLVPNNEYAEDAAEALYHHTITGQQGHAVLSHVMPEFAAVALFSINRDLRLVITDHFTDVRFSPLMASVWRHFYRRHYSPNNHCLYAYFHNGQLDVFAFLRGRFRFANCFAAKTTANMAYFLLAAWNQLGFDAKRDEVAIAGLSPQQQPLRDELERFLSHVNIINSTAEFRRSPITRINGLPFDLMTLFIKGDATSSPAPSIGA